jgi:hypothetical protein
VSLDSNMWWQGPFVLMVLRLVHTEALLLRAKRNGEVLVFRGALSMRVLFACGIAGLSFGVYFSIGREEMWLLLLAATMVLGLCLAWPATISLGPDGLRRHLWWRRTTAIPWTEVTGIQKNQGEDIEVFGRNGQSISFTRYHIDPYRFEREVKWRAKLDRTLDPALPPSIR